MKNNNVNCPLCSKTHKIVIEFESEMQHHKTLCIEHKKDMNLFCTESGCEIPICVLCLKAEHKNHEFGDLDEVMSERCKTLLAIIQSLKKKIQTNENRLITVHNEEIKNSNSCIESIKEYEKTLIRKIQKKMQKKVTEVQDRKTQLESNSKEAVGKLKDTYQMLESIEETCTGPLSHKRLMEKEDALKKSKAHVRDALSNVKKYIHVEFTESKIPNKTIAELCGQVTDDIKKLKDCKVKGTNKEGKKQQVLGEEESDDSRVVLSEQRTEGSTENEIEDVGSAVSVQEIGDDAVKMMKTKLTRKRKTKDTPEKESVAGSSSKEKDANSQTTPVGNQPDRRSLTKESDTPNGRSFTRGSDIPNARSLTRGSNLPNTRSLNRGSDTPNARPLSRGSDTPNGKSPTRGSDTPSGRSLTRGSDTPSGRSLTRASDTPSGRSLTRESDTPSGRSLARGSDTPNGKSFTRGTCNGDLPMTNTRVRDDSPATHPGNQDPPAKRTRWDVAHGSATIKFKSEGKCYCVIYLFPCHRLVMNKVRMSFIMTYYQTSCNQQFLISLCVNFTGFERCLHYEC